MWSSSDKLLTLSTQVAEGHALTLERTIVVMFVVCLRVSFAWHLGNITAMSLERRAVSRVSYTRQAPPYRIRRPFPRETGYMVPPLYIIWSISLNTLK